MTSFQPVPLLNLVVSPLERLRTPKAGLTLVESRP
jgi:hypothetical protein